MPLFDSSSIPSYSSSFHSSFVLFYSILLYSIIFSSILFYSILLHCIQFCISKSWHVSLLDGSCPSAIVHLEIPFPSLFPSSFHCSRCAFPFPPEGSVPQMLVSCSQLSRRNNNSSQGTRGACPAPSPPQSGRVRRPAGPLSPLIRSLPIMRRCHGKTRRTRLYYGGHRTSLSRVQGLNYNLTVPRRRRTPKWRPSIIRRNYAVLCPPPRLRSSANLLKHYSPEVYWGVFWWGFFRRHCSHVVGRKERATWCPSS